MTFEPSPSMRHGTRYEQVEASGASGYFSAPSAELDPHLFVGDRLRANVRNSVLKLLRAHWLDVYERPEEWSTVWIAGSGVSYQWNAERGGVGDLDVLIGIDMRRFLALNPEFRGIPEEGIAGLINKEMHDRLWPTTAMYDFGGQKYEVTFYVNPSAEDITEIVPYAAYDVTHDEWTVPPIELPANWGPESLPPEWRQKFAADAAFGAELITRFNRQAAAAAAATPGSPQHVNAKQALDNTIQQVAAFFDDLHLGRKKSFSRGGPGYMGFENARWQAGKASGIIDGLRKIRAQRSIAVKAINEERYGGPIEGASESAVRASLWATKFGRT